MPRLTGLYLFLYCFILCNEPAFADTLYLKNGKETGEELKGIIVEDYNDRVVLSTFEGEKTIFKKSIRNIVYDAMEQNLVKLGEGYLSRGEYEKAYFYYEKAYKTNPDYKLAREKMNYVMGYLFRKGEKAKLSDIEKRQEFEDWPAVETKEEGFEKNLKNQIGIQITEEDGRMKIKEVVKDSPASFAGLKPNDRLVAVWGRLTGYMSLKELARLLLDESSGEIKIGVERDVILKKEKPYNRNYRDIIGGKVDMLMEGLTIVDLKKEGPGQKADLKKGDLIIALNDAPTRYTPLDEAMRIIEDKNEDAVTFIVKREMTIWRNK